MTTRPDQAETLEQRIKELSWSMKRSATEQEARDHAETFARKLLEEAKPYIIHLERCKWYANKACDCGLAELMEGWSK